MGSQLILHTRAPRKFISEWKYEVHGDLSALGLTVPSLWSERGTETEEWEEDCGRV